MKRNRRTPSQGWHRTAAPRPHIATPPAPPGRRRTRMKTPRHGSKSSGGCLPAKRADCRIRTRSLRHGRRVTPRGRGDPAFSAPEGHDAERDRGAGCRLPAPEIPDGVSGALPRLSRRRWDSRESRNAGEDTRQCARVPPPAGDAECRPHPRKVSRFPIWFKDMRNRHRPAGGSLSRTSGLRRARRQRRTRRPLPRLPSRSAPR